MNKKNIAIGIIVIAIISFLSIGAISQFQNENKKAEADVVPVEVRTNSVPEQVAQLENSQDVAEYKNGVYNASGFYMSPAGQEEVDISITLENGLITNADFTGKTNNSTSKRLQNLFDQGFEAQVVGLPVDSIALTVVNGSSLTPKGFMDALNKVKNEARKS